MISIVINADTRPPMDRDVFTVGDDGGQGSLHGCRSWDYLTHLPLAVHKFFEGHDHEVLLFIDEHEPIPSDMWAYWNQLSQPNGWLRIISEKCDHSSHRWNDRLYLHALDKGINWPGRNPDYVVHMDQDCVIFRDPKCDIVDRYKKWLNEGYEFICQPTNLEKREHGMWWASTRFFMCKRATLNFDRLWASLDRPDSLFSHYAWSGPNHFPCLEHLLGVVAGDAGVLYPPREDDGYLVFSWARYIKGILPKLLDMPYSEVEHIVASRWGLCGPNDVIAQDLV